MVVDMRYDLRQPEPEDNLPPLKEEKEEIRKESKKSGLSLGGKRDSFLSGCTVTEEEKLAGVKRAEVAAAEMAAMQAAMAEEEANQAGFKISFFNSEASLVEQPWFNGFIGIMVLLNTINMGLEVDLTLGSYGTVTTHLFTATWTVEFILKIAILGPREYFGSGMNIMDFSLACMSLVDSWVLPMLGSSADLGSLSILRLLRLFRLVRLVKLLRSCRELCILMEGLVRALAVLVWVIILLLVLIYAGAIFLTKTVGTECDKPEYEDFDECFMLYGTLLRSMLTLFQVVTDGYMDVARPVFEKKPWMVIFFIGFVYLTTFGLMNIVAGVIFEQVLQTNEQCSEDKAERELEQERQQLLLVQKVLEAADVDDEGRVSPSEWLSVCEQEAVRKIFTSLGLNVSRKRLAQRLYEVADADNTRNVSLDVMLERVFQLKTEGRLQNKDMTLLLMDVRHQSRRLDRLDDKLERVISMQEKMYEWMSVSQAQSQMAQHQMPPGPMTSVSRQQNQLSLYPTTSVSRQSEMQSRMPQNQLSQAHEQSMNKVRLPVVPKTIRSSISESSSSHPSAQALSLPSPSKSSRQDDTSENPMGLHRSDFQMAHQVLSTKREETFWGRARLGEKKGDEKLAKEVIDQKMTGGKIPMEFGNQER